MLACVLSVLPAPFPLAAGRLPAPRVRLAHTAAQARVVVVLVPQAQFPQLDRGAVLPAPLALTEPPPQIVNHALLVVMHRLTDLLYAPPVPLGLRAVHEREIALRALEEHFPPPDLLYAPPVLRAHTLLRELQIRYRIPDTFMQP